MNKKFIRWEDIELYIAEVDKFYRHEDITGVYGLPRGGLVFAVLLSHKMNIPLLQAPCDGCIIIDDICDSGESLLHYYKNSSGEKRKDYHITTMFYKENDLVKPEYYYSIKEKEWIVYPWEVE